MSVTNDHRAAEAHLRKVDSDWAALIAQIGPCQLEANTDREPFEALVRSVAYQQLHTRAGDTILARMLALYPQQRFPSAQQLAVTDPLQLRACGYSMRKLETMIGIAEASLRGELPDRKQAEDWEDETLIRRLTTLRGVGRWTVEMMLIFTLGRPDVLPVGDFGVRDGYRRLKRLDSAPNEKQIAAIGEPWAPWRSVASWYLWRLPRD